MSHPICHLLYCCLSCSQPQLFIWSSCQTYMDCSTVPKLGVYREKNINPRLYNRKFVKKFDLLIGILLDSHLSLGVIFILTSRWKDMLLVPSIKGLILLFASLIEWAGIKTRIGDLLHTWGGKSIHCLIRPLCHGDLLVLLDKWPTCAVVMTGC